MPLTPRPTLGGLRVGCCGFPTSFARYAQTFPAVEVQQTFYQPPALKTLARWKSQAPAHAPCYVLFNNISMLADARRFQDLASVS